jgi:hypothetical protein
VRPAGDSDHPRELAAGEGPHRTESRHPAGSVGQKLRRHGIGDIATANTFLETEYWADHNRRFAQAPAASDDFHVARPRGLRLDRVVRLEEERIVSNDWVVRYANRHFQLERQSGLAPARSTVVVCESVDGHLEIRYRDRVMRWTEIVAGVIAPAARPTAIVTVSPPPAPRPARVAADHPWRHSFKQMGADGANWPLVDR